MSADKEYNTLNWLYNALYGDLSKEELLDLYFIRTHKQLVDTYDKNTVRLIDAACGNGIQALSLALNGYEVVATDISEEMINLTIYNAKKYGVNISTDIKAWTELPNVYKNSFDIVFCTGNSIVHSKNRNSRKKDLEALAKLLKSGGTLVLETRNWDKVIAENKIFTVYNKLSYKQKEYIPLYHWQLNGIENESNVDIILQEINEDNSVELYTNTLSFTPFTHNSLINQLTEIGMKTVADSYVADCDWYHVYCKNT